MSCVKPSISSSESDVVFSDVTLERLDGISYASSEPSSTPTKIIGAQVAVPEFIECCPFIVFVPTILATERPTIPCDEKSFDAPILLLVIESSPAIFKASFINWLFPLELQLTAINPRTFDSPSITKSCVRPSMSSKVAEVVLSEATVS